MFFKFVRLIRTSNADTTLKDFDTELSMPEIRSKVALAVGQNIRAIDGDRIFIMPFRNDAHGGNADNQS